MIYCNRRQQKLYFLPWNTVHCIFRKAFYQSDWISCSRSFTQRKTTKFWWSWIAVCQLMAAGGEKRVGGSASVYVRPERLERDGPCWLLKLRQMGTQRVHMKGVLTLLVRWARRAGTIDFCPALAALVGPVQNIIFLTIHYFALFVPITQQTRKAVITGLLSLNMCVWVWQCSWFLCVHYI